MKTHMHMNAPSTGLSLGWIAQFISAFSKKNRILYKFRDISIDAWPGDSNTAKSYIQGRFEFSNRAFSLNEFMDILSTSQIDDKSLLMAVHSFEWLREFRCISDSASRRLARELIQNWIHAQITNKQKTVSKSTPPHVAGTRLYNWISLYDFYASSAADTFHEMLVTSIHNQKCALQNSLKSMHDPLQKLIALKGILFAQAAFKEDQNKIQKSLQSLQMVMSQQINTDGSHITHSPDVQLYVLRDLIDIRTLLKNLDINTDFLTDMIIKMTPIVRLLRHGDGMLAKFQNNRFVHYYPGSKWASQSLIDMVLTLADVRGKTPSRATGMGYERIHTKNALVLINTKTLTSQDQSFFGPGLGIFNFEWSNGKSRYLQKGDVVIQNHSNKWITLPMDGESPAVHTIERHIDVEHHLFEGRMECVTTHKNTTNDPIAVNYGRDIYVNGDGTNIRGADNLYLTTDAVIGVRFVFEPGIEITTTQGTNTFGALIKIPKTDKKRTTKQKSKNGGFRLCRFICHGADDITVHTDEKSGKKAMLLIINGQSERAIQTKWAFHLQPNL